MTYIRVYWNFYQLLAGFEIVAIAYFLILTFMKAGRKA